MPPAFYDDCPACDIRLRVAVRLYLTALSPLDESPTAFWWRLRSSGRLGEVLRLYDRMMKDRAESASIPRETRTQFLDRVEREGRRDQAERALARLLASGLSAREAQEKLVERFQPLDGSQTRAWATPDPWANGRLFRRKKVQEELLAAASPEGKKEAARRAAADLVERARHRQEERVTLADARQFARSMAPLERRQARSERAAARAAKPSGAAT
jgi:hypothetical protein